MRKSKKFIGMPVISLAEGQQIGVVKGLVVDPNQQKVAALLIDQKGWFRDQKFAPYAKVRSVGNDAITLDQSSVVEKGTSLPEILSLYKERLSIIGCRVLAENGSQLGQVEEFYVEGSSGNIVGLELSGNLINSMIKGKSFLDISFITTLGKELVVTSNDALDSMVKIDGGLQETVKHIKDSTSQLWESTLQKTKELGNKTKELSSKTKEDLESKSKELTGLTKDLGESLTRQFDKVRGKKKQLLESEEKELPRATQSVEDRVQVVDLPPDLHLLRTEESINTANDSVQEEPRSFGPAEDPVMVVELPPEIQLPRNEEQQNESTDVDIVVEEQPEKTADKEETSDKK